MIRLSSWCLVILASGAVGWLAYRTHAVTVASAERERALEAARLRAEGQIVAERVGREQLEAEVEGLRRRVPALNEALAKALKAAPGARPVAVVGATTGPIVCAAPALSQALQEASCEPCALRPGQPIEIGVSEVVLKNQRGSLTMTGIGTAYRLEPSREALASAPFDYQASNFSVLDTVPSPAPVPSGWGVGPLALASTNGWAAGLSMGLPPLHVGAAQLDVLGFAGIGTAGVVGAVSVVGRL